MVPGVARKGTSYAYFGTLRSPIGDGAKPLPAAIRRQAYRRVCARPAPDNVSRPGAGNSQASYRRHVPRRRYRTSGCAEPGKRAATLPGRHFARLRNMWVPHLIRSQFHRYKKY
jgi:hypothetical protein